MRMCKTFRRTILMGFLICWVCSCSSKPVATIPPDYVYREAGIRLYLKSDANLNTYDGSPHTLVLCAYQLRDPNTFNQLLEETGGIAKLLECSRFDPSVTHSRRWFVNPEREVTETLDRFEGTKYVSIVAGYYVFRRENAVLFFRIPVSEETKGKTITMKVEKLNIDLYLGPQKIHEIRGK
jgi:predicted component of type VI protein secretion system